MARKKWETLLNEATELIKNSRENIYDAVERMIAVSKDAGFLDFYGGEFDKAVGCLDDLLGGFNLTFAEAELMMRYFPARGQWRSASLADMLAESIVKRNAEEAKESPPRAPINRPSAKELERIKADLGEERTKSANLATEVARYVSETDQLRARIRDLENENQRLQGRIEELQRLLKTESVGV